MRATPVTMRQVEDYWSDAAVAASKELNQVSREDQRHSDGYFEAKHIEGSCRDVSM